MKYNDNPEDHPDPQMRKLGERLTEINQKELALERGAGSPGRTDLDRIRYWSERAQNAEDHRAVLQAMHGTDPTFRTAEVTSYIEKLGHEADDSQEQAYKHVQKVEHDLGFSAGCAIRQPARPWKNASGCCASGMCGEDQPVQPLEQRPVP